MTRGNTAVRKINQFSLVLNESVSESIRRYCFEKRITLSEAFEEAVTAYLVDKGEIKNGSS